MPEEQTRSVLRGRRNECAALDRLLDAVRAQQSRVLVVRGEAGVGKTAMLDYLAANADGCHIARAAGVESEMELGFAGLHQLCAPLLDRLELLPPPQRNALSIAFGLSAGQPPDRFLVGLAALSLLSDMAEERPLVCLVDDAQWLDRASAQVLAFVARRLLAEAVALVFAVREPDEGNELAGIPDLTIGGLGDNDARALLDWAVPWRLDDRVVSRIIAETGGNPLALLELPRGLTAAELDFGFGLPQSMTLVNRIEESFLRQLQPLPEDTRRLLLIAAVEPLGDLALLWRAAENIGIDRDAAAPAEAAGLIKFGVPVRFRHPLVRSAARRAADARDVREAHRVLAEVSDAQLDPDRRAWHRAHAVAGSDETVATDLEQAAVRARGRGGFAAEAALLERAIELTPDPAKRGSRALAAAYAKFFAAEFEDARELVATAALSQLDELERAKLERLRATLVFRLDRSDEGSLMMLEAAKRFEQLDPETARGAYLGALGTRIVIGRLGDIRRLRHAAEQSKSAPPAPDPPRVTDLLLDALATWCTDGYRAGLTPLRQAIQACEQERESGAPDQLVEWLAFAPPLAPEAWDDQAWHRLTSHLVTLARYAGAINAIPFTLDYRASFDVHAGQLAAASAVIDEATVMSEATGNSPPVTSLELAAWRGHGARGLELIETSIEFWTASGRGRNVALAEYSGAVLLNGLGRYHEARDAARRACEHEDLGVIGWALAELVEASVRSGDLDTAVESVRRLGERTGAAGTDWGLGVEARSRALITDGNEAETQYRDAIDRLTATLMQGDLARAHLLYGEWLRRANRRVDARVHLRTAHEMFQQMGADAFGERARRELFTTGETVLARSIHRHDVLTAQEMHIAQLARAGATNPEIGSQLFVSPRTVEYHLHKVFTKLGINSRRELRGALPGLEGAASAR